MCHTQYKKQKIIWTMSSISVKTHQMKKVHNYRYSLKYKKLKIQICQLCPVVNYFFLNNRLFLKFPGKKCPGKKCPGKKCPGNKCPGEEMSWEEMSGEEMSGEEMGRRRNGSGKKWVGEEMGWGHRSIETDKARPTFKL
jgi:hypothetical protein